MCLLFFIYVFSSNFHLSTLFQHFGERYIKFIVTYCNTKCGNQNIWLLLIVSGKLTSDWNKLSDYQVWWFQFFMQSNLLMTFQSGSSRTLLYPAGRLCCQVLSNFQESSFTFFSLVLSWLSLILAKNNITPNLTEICFYGLGIYLICPIMTIVCLLSWILYRAFTVLYGLDLN